jgi:hypothetical protein
MPGLLIIVALLGFVFPTVATQPATMTIAAAADSLSLDQQTKLADLLTRLAQPVTNVKFPLAIDSAVPAEVEVRPLPSQAETIVPQFRGFGYVIIEEQIAIVDQPGRRIVAVIQRGLRQ